MEQSKHQLPRVAEPSNEPDRLSKLENQLTNLSADLRQAGTHNMIEKSLLKDDKIALVLQNTAP